MSVISPTKVRKPRIGFEELTRGLDAIGSSGYPRYPEGVAKTEPPEQPRQPSVPWLPLVLLVLSLVVFWIWPWQRGDKPVQVEFEPVSGATSR